MAGELCRARGPFRLYEGGTQSSHLNPCEPFCGDMLLQAGQAACTRGPSALVLPVLSIGSLGLYQPGGGSGLTPVPGHRAAGPGFQGWVAGPACLGDPALG